MSTVHELLSMLQDSGKRSPTSIRHLLLELASCCRCEDAKAAILADGLEPLLALAADDQELPRGETLEVLLELLVLLLLDNPKAKMNAAKGGALELAVRCLHELSAGAGGGRRRAKILKRALELVDLLSHTPESQQQERQAIILKQILEIMARTDEDVSVLVRASDTLGRFVDGSLERIQSAAKEHSISILIELLRLNDEKVDLKRTAFEVLMLMSEAPGMLQMMATHNIVSALCICLSVEPPSHEVELSVIRLLLRLAREARVCGEIVQEEMVPLLFRVIERNSNSREVSAATCTIIADLSDFARECKLDLSPFVDDCRGKVLVLAATCHAQEANVVDSTFRFFVNVSNNPVDLPQLINSETIEGLLSLYVLAGGSGYLAELAGHLVHVISRLSRAALEQFTIQEEDITLPALFLCLRNYHEDIRFSSQVFAIMAKHWKMQCQNKSVHGITGYVGIAIEVLCRTIPSSRSWGDQTVDIINFIREVLLSTEGADVVLNCGGKDLLEVLHTCLPVQDETFSASTGTPFDNGTEITNSSPPSPRLSIGERIAFVLVNMLEKAVLGLTDLGVITDISLSESSINDQQSPSLRFGDAEYDAYVSRLFHLENSCHFKPIESGMTRGDTGNSEHENTLATVVEVASAETRQDGNETNSSDQTVVNVSDDSESVKLTVSADSNEEDEVGFNTNGEMNAENAEDENDDDSDNDDDDGNVEPARDLGEVNDVSGECSFPSNDQSPVERENPLSSTGTSNPHVFDHLEDMQWYYVDSSHVKYPKHPSRRSQEDQNNPEEEFVLNEPGFLEPCNLPDAETSTRFVDGAVERRAEFVASDVNTRARIVYENLSMVEDCGEKVTGIPPFLLSSSAGQHDAPYFVPDTTTAFSDLTTSLTFDSNFESGNLERAIRIGPYEYDLVLKHDFNSSGHMQWFYFAVSNIQTSGASPRGGQKYRFNIVNLCKPNSLFNQGLQPVVYSVQDARQNGKGWVRSGTDIYYFANSYVRPLRNAVTFPGDVPTEMTPVTPPPAPTMTYYTLTFTLEFWDADDTYLVAHSYPYTLTMHQLHIDGILNARHDTRRILRHSSLCTTLSGRNCDLLTISDFSVSQQELVVRKAVFISSRVHPGESQASWMMRGVIDFLLGNSDTARVLRRMFVFQIIPMLNPDGVYYGNSRCGLAACDLNRQWQTPSKALHPTIFHAKELLVKECSTRGVVFYCDMHGHSRKKNIFMYGCDTKRKPNPAARAFAKLFSTQQTAKKYISLPDCSFKVSRDKETTARVVVASELKISWSFTLEASFCGANYGELQNMHFNTKHMREAGASLCETLFQACISDSDARDRLIGLVHDATVCIPQQIESHLREAGATAENLADEDSSVNPRSSFLKGKFGSGLPPKSVRRKLSKARALGASDSKLTEAVESSGRRRRLSQQPKKSSSVGSGLLDGVSRDVSIPAFVSADDSAACLDLAYIPPPKLSGKKLRSKYPKVRRTKSSPDGHVKSRRRAIPSLSSSDTADKTGDPRNQVATTVSGTPSNCPSNDSIMPLVSPSKLPGAVPGPPTSSVRVSLSGVQIPESTYLRPPKSISFLYPGNVLGIQLRDSSVILPPPVGEVVTRSPKAPANRIRFRGAGRQFSAVNTIPRTSIHDILRSDSVTAFQTYEADLINASTMVIRQRGNVSSNNNATAAADEKSLPPPSSTYLSFPSVI